MAKVITFANQKGGVSKSASAEAMAGQLHAAGARVLLVDLDAQANLSAHVGADLARPGSLELLSQRRPCRDVALDCIQSGTSFGDVIVGSKNLEAFDARLVSRVACEFALQRALAPVGDDYDYVIVDTAPALGCRTVAGIMAADDIIIPTDDSDSALRGLIALLDKIEEISDAADHEIKVAGILLANVNQQTRHLRNVKPQFAIVAERRGTRLFETVVRHAVVVKEAQALATPLCVHAPLSTAAIDYKNFVIEYLKGGCNNGKGFGERACQPRP